MVFSKDEMFDIIMLYWFFNFGVFFVCYYWENKLDLMVWGIDILVGVSWFGGDNSYVLREWCEWYYKNIVYWREMDRGGYFVVWEVFDFFVVEVWRWLSKIRL